MQTAQRKPGSSAAGSRLHFDPEQVRARARVMKALGHPVRLHIIEVLGQEGDQCLSDLIGRFSIRQPTLSRHVTVLRQAGLVTERRAGTHVFFHLATPCILRAFDCALQVVQADHQRRTRSLPEKA